MKKYIYILAILFTGLSYGQMVILGSNGNGQQISLVGNTLKLTGSPDVDLSAYLDNTDGQTVTDLSLTGNILSITLSGGNTRTVDLSAISLQDNAVTSAKILNGTIDELDLDASVNASLDKADTALQENDTRENINLVDANGVGIGISGANDALNLTAGSVASRVQLVLDDNQASITGLTNAEINTIGATSLVTKGYADATYTGGGGSTTVVNTYGSTSATDAASINLATDLNNRLNSVVAGTGNPNEVFVNTLADLQGVTANKTALIIGSVDLINTNVTLPANVYIKDGGGSIVTSGTGLLKTSAGSHLDNSILNSGLNWDQTSLGQLTNETTILDLLKFPINQTITGVKWDNATTIAQATVNKNNINKVIKDTKLFEGQGVSLGNIDCYVYNSPLGGVDYASYNLQETHGFAIQIPSRFTLSDATLRNHPSDTYSANILSSLETEDIEIRNMKLYGSRTTHNYLQKRRIFTASTASSIQYTIGANDALVTYTIPITPSNLVAQVQEISNFINANTQLQGLGYTSYFELNGSNSAFFVRNNTDGFYFRAYGSTANGYTETLTLFDITAEMGIALIGVVNAELINVTANDCYGDGLVVAGNKLSSSPTFINSRNITVRNSFFINNRRNNISPVGVETMLISQCQIHKAGNVDGINDGSAPRLGIDCEPTRTRDQVTGIVDDANIVRGVVIENCLLLDNEYGSINLYSSYNSVARNNIANGRISAQLAIGGVIEGNTVDFRLGEDVNRSTIGNQRAFELTGQIDTYTTKVELASSINFIGNKVFGRGVSAPGNETGFYLQGWNVDASHNEINNVGLAFNITALRDSHIYSNIVGVLADHVGSEGFDITSTALRNVSIEANTVSVYDLPIYTNSINSDSRAAAINMSGTPSLIIKNNDFESINNIDSRFRSTRRTVISGNVFRNGVTIDNTTNDISFRNNILKDKLTVAANGVEFTDVEISGNKFNSSSTNPNLEMYFQSSSLTNSNIEIFDNTFRQNSGLRALWIYNNGKQPENIKIFNNKLLQGSPTNFLDFNLNTSLIFDNYNLTNGTPFLHQTISGAGNTIVASSQTIQGTGTAIPLTSKAGYFGNSTTANTATTYTTTGNYAGTFAQIRINAATEPTVTGAIKIAGSTFVASTDMYLNIRANGNRVEFYFTTY